MTHRNLFEKAKPELLKALAQNKVDYPNTGAYIENALKENHGVSFLPYGVVVDLRGIASQAKLKFDINNPWAWFEDK
jgi:hypothetical protein